MAEKRASGPLDAVMAETPHWLRLTGVYGWMLAGALILFGSIFWMISYTSDLSMPLVVALVLGVLFAPTVEWLAARKVPRALGAAVVLVVLIAIVALTLGLVITGVVGQSAVIGEQVSAGFDSISAWAAGLNLPAGLADQIVAKLGDAVKNAGGAIASTLSKGISGTATAFSGLFLGTFMLFFILEGWGTISLWIGRHMGIPEEVGAGLISDGVSAMRDYFKTVTITGIIVAVIVGVAVALLGVPLAVPIALVTWVTCYIPFVGAFVSSGFAVLVALGSGGVGVAFAVLAVVIIAQNVVQMIIQNRLASESLNIHPLALIIATILGGIAGGLLGSMLAPALLAFALRATSRLKGARDELRDGEPAAEAAAEPEVAEATA